MTVFFIPPEAGFLLGLILIGVLIWKGLKSAARSLDTVDQTKTMTWKELKKQIGPMTWEERIVSVILIAIIVAISIGLAMIT
jgi:hypothetical protein